MFYFIFPISANFGKLWLNIGKRNIKDQKSLLKKVKKIVSQIEHQLFKRFCKGKDEWSTSMKTYCTSFLKANDELCEVQFVYCILTLAWIFHHVSTTTLLVT